MTLPWFVRTQPRPQARCRLFCFPYAGVGASIYRAWTAELPQDVDLWAVQPPGRETRFREAPFDNLDDLVDSLAAAMGPVLDQPFAFFGHSMGACVAFELTRRLAQEGAAPVRLFVSGRRAPGIANTEPPMHTLPDDLFIAELRRRYDGIPAAVMQHPELLELLLPGLRADIAALERHSHRSTAPLDCPISALGGSHDPVVSTAELAAWRNETTSDAWSLRLFAGGHFYLQTARQPLLETLAATLRADLASSPVVRVG